jgi:hypothetical protein
MKLVWHYAPWAYLSEIVTVGALVPTNEDAEGEQPMVWFSARQDWEPSSAAFVSVDNSTRAMTLHEQQARLGCIRFGLPGDDARLLPWTTACRVARMSLTKRRKKEAAGRRLGANPADWFAVGEAIPLVGLRFQVLVDRWGDADVSEAARLWAEKRG